MNLISCLQWIAAHPTTTAGEAVASPVWDSGCLEEVCGALAKGETVKLSSFGTFAVRQKSQRMGRNPKTGDEVPIAPRRVLVFRPSHVLKAVINGQTPSPEAED